MADSRLARERAEVAAVDPMEARVAEGSHSMADLALGGKIQTFSQERAAAGMAARAEMVRRTELVVQEGQARLHPSLEVRCSMAVAVAVQDFQVVVQGVQELAGRVVELRM